MPDHPRFWLWWPIAGMVVLTTAFLWFIAPLDPAFRSDTRGVGVEIADGVFRFSYFVLNPSLIAAWAALPWLHGRGLAAWGWRLLAFVALLLGLCIGAVLALR